MKCRLEDESYCDKNFQIEFDTVKQIEELRDSLTHMIRYIKLCQSDGDEIPPLIYRITEVEQSKTK
jgi:hypothetical protein